LSKQGEEDSAYKIKNSIRHFFKKRDFFNLVVGDNINSPNSKSQFAKLVTVIRSSVELKKISGKSVSGAIICNMVQAYVHRLNKKAPAVIFSAFERAVAAESRRNKEKLFIRYLDKMGLLENDLPCEEENLYKEHQIALKELLKEFDLMMISVFEQEEVQEERTSLVDRINAYYEDLKGANLKASESKCREIFKAVFDPLRQTGLKFLDDGTTSISELEQQFLAGIQRYHDSAAGPCIESVFSEEISFLVPHMCTLLREVQNHIETEKEELQKEVKSLTRHRDEARAGEKRLRDLLDDTNKNYEKQLEQRTKEISDLQANVNTRIHMAENKSRTQAREIQGLKLELEQAQKEREMMIEAERDIYEKRIADIDSKMYKLQLENGKYERMLDDLREEQEKLIAEKNEQINDLSRKLKLIETQPDPNPRQDASVLRSFKDYLEDIFNKFSKEQNANAKYLSQLERVASLQNELNQVRIREQESRNKLIDEYEEKIKQSRAEHDAEVKNFNETLEKQKEELKLTFESVSTDMEKQNRMNSEREDQIKRLMEEKLELSNELGKREQQLSDQYEVIDAYKKQMQQLQTEIEDRDTMLNRLKIENVEEKDDNDILINFMGVALEVFQKRKNAQTIHIGKIQNHENRAKVAKLFKKFGVPYE
jgi:Guanylate-binding protein, C-terminal domain